MVIYLLNELIDGCNLNSDEPLNLTAFETIADCYKHNFHFVIGDREILEVLSLSNKISDNAKSVYNRMFQRYTLETSILSNVDFTIKIGLNNSSESSSHMININELTEHSFLNFNYLLLEYTSDTYVYEKIIDFYLKSNSLQLIEYRWELMNGGGNTIGNEYDRIIANKKAFSYCIVDSDKISPLSPLGPTSKVFEDKIVNVWGKHFILPTHEIENLVPKGLYIKYINHRKDQKLNLNLSYLNLDNDIYYYLDIKKGINKMSLRNQREDVRDYYLERLNLEVGFLHCECETNCNCHIIQPFGRGILANVKQYILDNDLNIFDYLCTFLTELYSRLGKQMFEIFCRPNRKII